VGWARAGLEPGAAALQSAIQSIILTLSLTAKVIYHLDFLKKDSSKSSEVKTSENFSIPREVS
jgi:hypothetical protein